MDTSLYNKQPAHWEVLHEALHADCRIYQVHRHECRHPENGREGSFYVIKGSDFVQALALTQDGALIMVRQYRFGSQALSWEVPGGVMEAGETPVQGALRELHEETGYTGSQVHYLGFSYPNPATQANKVHFVLIENCTYTGSRNLDPYEDIQVQLMPLETVWQMLDQGDIQHALIINALWLLKRHTHLCN